MSLTSSTDAWLRRRKAAQADLFTFARGVIGFRELYLPLHRRMADFWMAPPRRKVGVWPREHFKSSMFCVAGPLWEVVRGLPEEPVFPPKVPLQCLIAGENEKIPVPNVDAIRSHIEGNEVFKGLFPEIKPGRPWQSTRICVQRAHDPRLRQNTVEIMGGQGNPTSPHYNLIVCDDLIGFSNYESPEGREKAWKWLLATEPLLLTGGMEVVAATRWSEDDLVGRIMKLNPKLPTQKQWLIEHHGCYDPVDSKTPIFPTIWPVERLEAARMAVGEEMFALWYLNDPIDPATAFFRPNWLQYWESGELPAGLETVVILDTAPTVTAKSDFSALIVAGARGETRFVLEAKQMKTGLTQLAEEVRRAVRVHGCSKFGIETYGPQLRDLQFFEAEYRKGGMPKPERLTTYSQADAKKQRIRSLAPHIEYGNIRVHRTQDDLIQQILRWPKCLHDDLLDAVSYVPEMLPFGIDYTAEEKAEIRARLDVKPGDFLVEAPSGEPSAAPTWGWL